MFGCKIGKFNNFLVGVMAKVWLFVCDKVGNWCFDCDEMMIFVLLGVMIWLNFFNKMLVL